MPALPRSYSILDFSTFADAALFSVRLISHRALHVDPHHDAISYSRIAVLSSRLSRIDNGSHDMHGSPPCAFVPSGMRQSLLGYIGLGSSTGYRVCA